MAATIAFTLWRAVSLTLYIGVTSDLRKRVVQHKTHLFGGFSGKYKYERLVYFERFVLIDSVIAREKEIKGWRREKKIALIKATNPTWLDMAEEWYTKKQMS